MKSVNNENTKILELQQEAIKNKKRLHDERLTNSQEQSKSSKEILDEFLQSSSKIKNQNNFSKSNSISSAIIKFIEDLKKSINENHSQLSEKETKNLKKFLTGSSKVSVETDNGVDSANRQYLIQNFLKTTMQPSKNELPQIDVSSLFGIYREDVDTSVIKSIINSMDSDKKDTESDAYSQMLKSMDIKDDKINGLDSFIAATAIKRFSKPRPITVKSEVIRLNFACPLDLKHQDLVKKDTPKYDYFLDDLMLNLPEIAKLKKSMDLIKDAVNNNPDTSEKPNKSGLLSKEEKESISKADIVDKEYHVPNWIEDAKDGKQSGLDKRVKQLNKLSLVLNAQPLFGIPAPNTDFIDSLRSLLKFVNSSSPDAKEGFFQGGLAMDEISKIRKKMKPSDIDRSFYKSIADNAIMKFDKQGFVTYHVGILASPLILPCMNLGNFNVSIKPVSTMTGGYGQDNPDRSSFFHYIFNTSVDALLSRAPDFRQNMYHGIFVYTTPNGLGQMQELDEIVNSLGEFRNNERVNLATTSIMGNNLSQLTDAYTKVLKTYYVRMNGITIPGVKAEPYSIGFLNRTIKKVGNNFSESHKITIDFTVDEMGLIMRSFNILTGSFGYINGDDKHNIYANNIFPVDFSPENKGRLDLVVTYNDFRINPDYKNLTVPSKSNFMPAMQNLKSGDMFVTDRFNSGAYGDSRSYRQFVLEDIKILGISGKLQFRRDSAEKMTVPVDLMFRRIITMDNNAIL